MPDPSQAPPPSPWLSLVIGAIGGLLGYAGSVFVRWLTRPNLRVTFGTGDEYRLRAEATEKRGGEVVIRHNQCYIRLKVTNVGWRTARNCVGYLLNVQQYQAGNCGTLATATRSRCSGLICSPIQKGATFNLSRAYRTIWACVGRKRPTVNFTCPLSSRRPTMTG
jgi:hypothetical protein